MGQALQSPARGLIVSEVVLQCPMQIENHSMRYHAAEHAPRLRAGRNGHFENACESMRTCQDGRSLCRVHRALMILPLQKRSPIIPASICTRGVPNPSHAMNPVKTPKKSWELSRMKEIAGRAERPQHTTSDLGFTADFFESYIIPTFAIVTMISINTIIETITHFHAKPMLKHQGIMLGTFASSRSPYNLPWVIWE